MKFFERFKPNSSKIEHDEKTTEEAIDNLKSLAGYKKEESLDDLVPKLNQSLKTKEIISGDDPMEADERDRESVENLLVRSSEDFQVINDNIDIIRKEIEHNDEKIKQLNFSISKAEEEANNSMDDTIMTSVEGLKRMKNSLEKLNDKKEEEIKMYQSKMKNFYNLN